MYNIVRSRNRFEENTYVITDIRTSYILNIIENIYNTPYLTARRLYKLAGSIAFTKFVLADIIQLKARYLYFAIEERIFWDSKLKEEPHQEMLYWKENLTRLIKREFVEYIANTFNLASDASDTGSGWFFQAREPLNVTKFSRDGKK